MGLDAKLLHLDLVLPVGISFYTFQTMSYSLDIGRGRLRSTDRFLDFALFVSFFPQLVAGPIERATHLLPQVLNPRRVSFDQSMRGLNLILIGFFKKVGIADSIAGSVDSVFRTTGAVSGLDVTLATLLFAVQIYCDFSGYSDIARGTAKLFGVELMANFNQPYFSTNPSEFWRRWHISLSTWLRDYLYITLGGNRVGTGRIYGNLMITMLLGGLWHGAAWNFALWGAYQGVVLCIHRWLSRLRPAPERGIGMKLLVMSGFFVVTCYGWLLFRGGSMGQIVDFTILLLTQAGDWSLSMSRPTLAGLVGLPLLVLLEVLQYRAGTPRFYLGYAPLVRGALYALMLVTIALGMSNAQAQFIYFQF
jgi:D-alanyl-lipoteichoic acid acyltransferase DltB (MBOAT superfamily)